MCLQTITKRFGVSKKREYYGYKLFRMEGSHPTFRHKQYKFSRFVPLKKWIKAETKQIFTDDVKGYETGFHIYKSIRKAKLSVACKVFKVMYKDLIVEGSEWNGKVIVARKMKVLGQVS